MILDGLATTDADGDGLLFNRTQVGVLWVDLDDANSPTPSFTAPAVDAGDSDLVFRLVITDDDPVNSLEGTLPAAEAYT